MKKNALIILALVMTFISIYSCSNGISNVTESENTKEALIKNSLQFGVQHNENMKDVFNQLKADRSIEFTKDNLIQVIENTTVDVLIQSLTTKKSGVNNENLEKIIRDFFTIEDAVPYLFSENTRSSTSIDDDYGITMSDNLISLTRSLIIISDDLSLTIEQHQKKISELNELAFNTLDDSEFRIFILGSSVACASFEYWRENASEWLDLLSNENKFTTKSRPQDSPLLKGMVGADIGGAVAGAAASLVTAGIAAPLTIVAGSSGASLGKLAENTWNYFFG